METGISGIYSLLPYGLRHNDCLYECIAYIPGYLPALKGAEQVLYHYGDGAVGLHTDIVKLVKNGGKPIFMGFCCWVGITLISLLMQRLLGIW